MGHLSPFSVSLPSLCSLVVLFAVVKQMVHYLASSPHICRYAEGKSKFSEYVLNEGHEMKTIEETMSIIKSKIKLNLWLTAPKGATPVN